MDHHVPLMLSGDILKEHGIVCHVSVMGRSDIGDSVGVMDDKGLMKTEDSMHAFVFSTYSKDDCEYLQNYKFEKTRPVF